VTQGPGGTRRALLGYSGADLTLIEHPAGALVRKQARRVEQNDRLRAQAAKLAWAQAAGLACPALRDTGTEAGLYWFEMDYVPGESLANGLISGRAIDWPRVAAQVLAILGRMQAAAGAAIEPAAFRLKLADIARRCAGPAALRPMIPRIERAVTAMCAMDWSGVPDSPCHGDMTLENMLLRSDGSVVFIDFDVPEPSSFVLDIGKLYQDLLGQWFLRQVALRDPDGVELLNARLNLARAAGHFDAALAALMPGQNRIGQLAAFHLLRTLPYATDAAVPGFVLGRVEALLGRV
jgi:aminoglycoside phosphotransferase